MALTLRSIILLGVVGVVAAGAGCGSSQHDEKTTTTKEAVGPNESLTENRAKVDRMRALYAQLGDSVDLAEADCDAIARAISSWAKLHRLEIHTLSRELKAMPKAHVDELAPSLEKSMQRSVLQLKDGSDRCPRHEGIFDAISDLPR